MSRMHFSVGDVLVLLLYFAVSLAFGLFFSRRAGNSLTDYFLSGRAAPWWLVGTGMEATTFGADTPLWVAGKVATHGISGNWLWWSAAAGGMLTVFFFARLWRRAGVLTDVELFDIRSCGGTARFPRGFKAIYFGVFMNCIVMGWVNTALLTILRVLLPDLGEGQLQLLVIGAALLTLVYVAAAGLWGIMIADAFQFTVAMFGAILLAIYAANHPTVLAAGGLTGALPPEMFQFLPDFSNAGGGDLVRITRGAFFAYTLIQWWASWYPGAEPGGGGYVAQRIMSAKDERQGMLATLWFVVAHYCVRSWPWIVAALAAVVLYPELSDAEREGGYVQLIRDVLPSPLRGLVVAAFLGAYMSTLSTHLNWGCSYLINDFYKPFIRPGLSESQYVRSSRVATVLLAALALLLSFTVLGSIREAWDFLLSITGGMGFVLILRWYWSRVNAAAELAAMIAPLVALLGLYAAEQAGLKTPGAPENLYIIAPVSALVILLTMYLTPGEDPQVLKRFYDRVRPPGPGWRNVSGASLPGLGRAFAGWAAGVVLVYSLLCLIGAVSFAFWTQAAVLAVLFVIAVLVLIQVFRREFPEEQA